MVDWNPYLNSLCNAYTDWWTFGTLKDVVEAKRFEFGLMVQTVERDVQQRNKEEKIERLTVLEGLRKYASEHVLLVGRPGSGKSTALVRLLVEESQKALQNLHSQIPVLMELRTYKVYYKTSVLDLVQASLKRRRLRLNLETLEELLAQGRFLLLMDGINELPDDEARRTIKEFRLDYSDVPMVFTTRDLGVGGDLGIEKKLELQSLTEAEVEKFVREGMPGGSQHTLQQLRQRLRELGQTPFVMWMLYFIVQKTGTVPSGAGSAFREFTQLYERHSKDDAPVADESRRWWSRLLEHLGFVMMQADKPTDLRLTISKREAEEILTNFLDGEKFDKPRDYALRWLEDLLKHHLIQVTSNDQIEFCHQLIQEYYAAERLLEVLTSSGRTSLPAPSSLKLRLQGEGSKNHVPPFPGREGGLGLSDDELKRKYLNYLKWTEPLALMLEFVEDEAQAVRMVKLALEVDWRLGARLAGALKPKWQEQTVGFVSELDVPQLLKIELLSLTQSKQAIPEIVKALNHEDSSVHWRAAEVLGNIDSEAAIPELVNALNHADSVVRRKAAEALADIGSEAAINELVNALNHKYFDVCYSAAEALGKIGSEAAINELVNALNHADYYVRGRAAEVLGNIDSEAAISELVNAINDKNYYVRRSAAEALGNIGSEAAIPELFKALKDKDLDVRNSAAEALGNIGSEAAILELVNALNDEDSSVRGRAATVLGKIGSEAAIPELVNALNDKDLGIRDSAAEALGNIGSEAAIPELVNALNDEDFFVRRSAAEALGNIGSDAAIPELFKALNYEDSYYVRRSAAEALGNIGSDAAINELVNALNDEDSSVRRSAVEALGNIGSDAAINELFKALNDEDSDVRKSVAKALGNIGSDAAINELFNALNHEDSSVRRSAAEALGEIASSEVLPDLSLRLKTDREAKLFYTISAIQERCKFYNYTLTQPTSPPVSKSKPKKSPKQTKSISLMHILHLSDLHFGTLDNANLWSSQLAEDLRNELEIPQLDALILSGDIANYSTLDEYNATEQFLNKLRQQFPLTPEQIIIVPGNHDINWELAENAYCIERRKNYKGQLREGCYIDRGDIVEIRDEEDYKQRFANFSNFYQAIKGQPYPLDYEQQGILHHLTDQNLLILGLNSAWQLDHHYKTRANIHPIALSNALDRISRDRETYQNCLKISVWHHPIHSTGEDRITDAAFLDRLAVAGFRLFLHGHVHEAKTSNYRYDMTKDGRNLDQICAGTFGAPTKELVTGTPWQYNLLQFEGNKLTVRTRCRRKENGTWEPDSIWRQGKGKGSADFYTITL